MKKCAKLKLLVINIYLPFRCFDQSSRDIAKRTSFCNLPSNFAVFIVGTVPTVIALISGQQKGLKDSCFCCIITMKCTCIDKTNM